MGECEELIKKKKRRYFHDRNSVSLTHYRLFPSFERRRDVYSSSACLHPEAQVCESGPSTYYYYHVVMSVSNRSA